MLLGQAATYAPENDEVVLLLEYVYYFSLSHPSLSISPHPISLYPSLDIFLLCTHTSFWSFLFIFHFLFISFVFSILRCSTFLMSFLTSECFIFYLSQFYFYSFLFIILNTSFLSYPDLSDNCNWQMGHINCNAIKLWKLHCN